MNSSLTYSSLSNIQNFLNKFKRFNDISKFSSEIRSDNSIFSAESLLPDMWTKTRTPISRDKMYFFYDERRERRTKNKKTFPSNVSAIKTDSSLNYFPSIPLEIPSENINLKLESISVDELFKSRSNEFSEASVIRPNIFKPISKEEFLMNDIFTKTWVLSFFNEGKFMNYGPMSTDKVYHFLKNIYSTLPDTEKKRKNFMVVDSLCDFHYQPDTLCELLSAEYLKKSAFNIDSLNSLILFPAQKINRNAKNVESNMRKLEGIKIFRDVGEKENLKPTNLDYANKAFTKFSIHFRKDSKNASQSAKSKYSNVMTDKKKSGYEGSESQSKKSGYKKAWEADY